LGSSGRKELYTFWVGTFAFRRNAGFRMDFVLICPNLIGLLQRADVDAEQRGFEKPSDHAPM
jgi:exodeoxyribonuclease III